MKTLQLNVLKKNRVYFKCLNDGGYEVKLRITPKSENLTIGEHLLTVNDESVRTKYGTDLIYSMIESVEECGIVSLKLEYNKKLVEQCRNLGGRWDAPSQTWIFPKFVESEVEELEFQYGANIVTVDLELRESDYAHTSSFCFLGKPLFFATGRDSGAKVCEGISLISGSITSGGSVKNWSSEVLEGSVFRFTISKNLIDLGYDEKLFKLTILNTPTE